MQAEFACEDAYFPRLQSRHSSAPMEPENFPEEQGVQLVCPEEGAKYPGSQAEHADAEVAPIEARYLPALHCTHRERPVVLLYVPAGHRRQETEPSAKL